MAQRTLRPEISDAQRCADLISAPLGNGRRAEERQARYAGHRVLGSSSVGVAGTDDATTSASCDFDVSPALELSGLRARVVDADRYASIDLNTPSSAR